MKLLTPIQQKIFETELSQTISSPRWFVLFGILEDDSMDDAGAGSPELAEIRHAGMFVPEHQAIFNEKLSQCCSSWRWFCVFGTLDDDNNLHTQVRCMNFPAANSADAAILHAAMERLVFEALRQGEAWTRRLPCDEGLYRAIARGAFEGFESRRKIMGNGAPVGQLDMGGGLILGHGKPKAKPDEDE